MNVRKEFSVKKKKEKVWEVLAKKFNNVSLWASGVFHSQGSCDKLKLPVAGDKRSCLTKLGILVEDIIECDPSSGSLVYTAISEKPPFFIKNILNKWSVKEINTNITQVIIDLEITISSPLKFLLSPFVKRFYSKIISETAQEFAYYIEEGKPHPRKLKASEMAIAAG